MLPPLRTTPWHPRPAPGRSAAHSLPRPGAAKELSTDALDALTGELRGLYAETFRLALATAEQHPERYETPDSPADPVYIADNAACRTINRHLPTAMARWLPGARLDCRITEPAVIETTWTIGGRLVAIDLDYTYDFGDPNALTVREVRR